MKIVVAHNRYQLRGGEDMVVQAEVELLRAHGHTVELFECHNDAIDAIPKLKLAMQTVWSTDSARNMEALLTRFRPDVLHVHNTFPLISPSIYSVASKLHIAVVQTLHNFRLLCPQAMFLREGKVCEDCLGHVPWRAAVRACYRDSGVQSTVLAGMLVAHRALGTWQHGVSRYIALNEFCRSKFVAGGLPAQRIAVKPNFVDFDAPPDGARSGFLFVGRLTSEKGVHVLVEATKAASIRSVRVAGAGPMATLLAGVDGITALQEIDIARVKLEMRQAVALVLPSLCYESFPRTLVEAYASRLPVIASRHGPLIDLVNDGVTGLLFEPGDAFDLAQKMRWAQEHPDAMAQMGRNARALYESEFTGDRNYQMLLAIYKDAIGATHER